jgi:hypothetical protein
MVRASSAGLPERLSAAADAPILHSLVTAELWSHGIGSICLSRELPGGSVAFSFFLVDRNCLGVKDVMTGIEPRSDYDDRLRDMRSRFDMQELSQATARHFVESAVAYARELGLSPHPDYHRAKLIFGDIDPAEATEDLEFGHDGMPYFVSGPFDDEARCRQILATLERACGPGGYHYTVRVGPEEWDDEDSPDSFDTN